MRVLTIEKHLRKKAMEKEIIRYSRIHGVSFTEKSPSSFPPHWHSDAEFTLILKPGSQYSIGKKVFQPEPGDIILMWPRELHTVEKVPPEGACFIQFSSALIDNNIDLITASGFLKDHHHISAKSEPALASEITRHILSIGDIYNKKPYFAETRSKQIVYSILILLGDFVMQEKNKVDTEEPFSGKTRNYIHSACSFIADHYAEDISQAAVAAHTGLSPFYFSKIFKEYTQMTFPVYLAKIRVQNACNLLARDYLSITECAFLSGFQSTTTFNKCFREITGYTPREYRRLHRGVEV